MTESATAWLGPVPAMRTERHYGDRIVRCFAERPGSAYDLLADAARRNPEGEALVLGRERIAYRAFETLVRRCAAGLRAAGIGAGDRVGMLLGNGLAFPVVMFAAI
ncbi:MAG: long-chain fatty acid--CoA ligase, partial [Hyphomicrobiales bacterium]